MPTADETNKEQETLWNTVAGHAWVDAEETLDQMLRPFEERLVKAVVDASSGSVLDVGCGTGSTTVAFARQLGEQGRCIGIDISSPMIEAARNRAARAGAAARFIRADAQVYPFEPASFDLIVSRFGVMFFDDIVAAFANLRRAAKNGAMLRFIAWRSPEENAFMTTAERAARPLFPDMPQREPDAPGQFALADARHMRNILEESGWVEIDIQPLDVRCTFPEAELERYFTRLGPLGPLLQDIDEQTRTRVVQTVRSAYDPYAHDGAVRFDAACWEAAARAPSPASPSPSPSPSRSG